MLQIRLLHAAVENFRAVVERVAGVDMHGGLFWWVIKRFMLRGKEKVTIETGLPALAHNLRKKCKEPIKKAV